MGNKHDESGICVQLQSWDLAGRCGDGWRCGGMTCMTGVLHWRRLYSRPEKQESKVVFYVRGQLGVLGALSVDGW